MLGTASSSSSVPEYHGLDVGGLLEALLSGGDIDPEDWKASFAMAFPAEDVVVNGQFETNGDFLTEEST